MGDGVVCHSDPKHLPQRLLLTIHKSTEHEQKEISDCETCYSCPCFRKAGRASNSVRPYKTHSLIGPLTQSELAEGLRYEKVFFTEIVVLTIHKIREGKKWLRKGVLLGIAGILRQNNN